MTFFVWFKMALLISNYIKDQAGSRLENHLVVASFNPLRKRGLKNQNQSISFHITPKHRGTVSDWFPCWSLPSSCQVSNASAARQEVPWSFALPLLMAPRRRVVWAPCWKGSELRWEVAPAVFEGKWRTASEELRSYRFVCILPLELWGQRLGSVASGCVRPFPIASWMERKWQGSWRCLPWCTCGLTLQLGDALVIARRFIFDVSSRACLYIKGFTTWSSL